MYINDTDTRRILDAAEDGFLQVAENHVKIIKKSGQSFNCECPICGSPNFNINPAKKVFKCFKGSCVSGAGAINLLMKCFNKSYPEALLSLSETLNVPILGDPIKPKEEPRLTKKESDKEESFCKRMLRESGLTTKDVTASVITSTRNRTIGSQPTFVSGSMTNKGEIDTNGDDAIIKYFDLEGFPCTFDEKDNKGRLTGKRKEYLRVRYQYPDEHKDRDGRPAKYKSPYGAGTLIYIPDKIRELYRLETELETLFIQEGEKKAEKACKHGMMSVAVSGIQNLGYNKQLPEDIIRIIQRCKVKNVVFLLDSDWDNLSANLKISDNAAKRPRAFFSAVKNYKEYMKFLKSRDLYVEIYFGHVNVNAGNDKGVDDLLTNTLLGKEDELMKDFDSLFLEKEMIGKFLTCYKITTMTDLKLEELWGLDSPRKFAKRHIDVLSTMPEFTFMRNKWRIINEKGDIESAQPLEEDETYWKENAKFNEKTGETRLTYEFRYGRSYNFLRNRGFGRYLKLDGDYDFIHIEHPFVRTVKPWEIKDFIKDFTKEVAPEDVMEMIYKGGSQYLGPDRLENLDFLRTEFDIPSRERQMLYFKNGSWEITKDGIVEKTYDKVSYHIWADNKRDFPATILPPMFELKGDEIHLTPLGEQCHFLRFLRNASNFTWRKQAMIEAGDTTIEIYPEEIADNHQHLISKLCALGYMMMDFKDKSTGKAVVAMDGKQSEVGASNGRSGKSLLGELFRATRPSVYINGKKGDLTTDQFLWDEVTEKTKVVFVDDALSNFNIEFLFANITGDWAVNYKGGRRCTIPFAISPLLYITTNHALSGEGSSFNDRQWVIAFSDFYNDTHKPIHDFGVMFFDEWDFEQWNLCWNMIAQAIQLYMNMGVVESPQDRIEQRKLRQAVGEVFIDWADEYYSEDERINARISKKTLIESYNSQDVSKHRMTPTLFKKKFVKWCQLKGYVFNPDRYDEKGEPKYYDKDGKPVTDDKCNGTEYFTIGLPLPETTEDTSSDTPVEKTSKGELPF